MYLSDMYNKVVFYCLEHGAEKDTLKSYSAHSSEVVSRTSPSAMLLFLLAICCQQSLGMCSHLDGTRVVGCAVPARKTHAAQLHMNQTIAADVCGKGNLPGMRDSSSQPVDRSE